MSRTIEGRGVPLRRSIESLYFLRDSSSISINLYKFTRVVLRLVWPLRRSRRVERGILKVRVAAAIVRISYFLIA